MLLRRSGAIGRALIGHRRQRQRDGSVHFIVHLIAAVEQLLERAAVVVTVALHRAPCWEVERGVEVSGAFTAFQSKTTSHIHSSKRPAANSATSTTTSLCVSRCPSAARATWARSTCASMCSRHLRSAWRFTARAYSTARASLVSCPSPALPPASSSCRVQRALRAVRASLMVTVRQMAAACCPPIPRPVFSHSAKTLRRAWPDSWPVAGVRPSAACSRA
eukprot:scaffold8227_cov72-Phaeocystis_antarctica.AAC.11